MTEKSKDALVAILGGTVGTFLVLPLAAAMVAGSAVMHGYIFHLVWKWHAVAAFGWPSLSWQHAAGLMLALGLLRRYRADKQKDERETSEKVAEAIGRFVGPWIALLVAWWLT